MNEQKIREEFEAWADKEIGKVEHAATCNRSLRQALRNIAEAAWHAATAATQRDAMAVAEAVMHHASRHFHGGDPMPDLAAIVEAVRPGKLEAVNQRLLAALKLAQDMMVANGLDLPHTQTVMMEAIAAAEAAQPIRASSDVIHEAYCRGYEHGKHDGKCNSGNSSFVPGNIVSELCAMQPASAQQQGEPVAWRCRGGNVMLVEHQPNMEDWLEVTPLYTAPACSVPDGLLSWELLRDHLATFVDGACCNPQNAKMDVDDWAHKLDDIAARRKNSPIARIRNLLFSAQKPESGAV